MADTMCGANARFVIDLATPQDTRNLYFHLKDAWNAANNMERETGEGELGYGEDEPDSDEDFEVHTQ